MKFYLLRNLQTLMPIINPNNRSKSEGKKLKIIINFKVKKHTKRLQGCKFLENTSVAIRAGMKNLK